MLTNNFEAIVAAVENFRDPRISDRDAFLWENGIFEIDENGIYKVEFLSLLNPATARDFPEKVGHVLTLDDNALFDARGQPGFLHYFADEVTLGAARSFCLWRSAEEAERASSRGPHQAAVEYTVREGRDVYTFFEIAKSQMTMTESGLHIARLATMTVLNGEFVPPEKRQKAIDAVWPQHVVSRLA